MQLQFRLPMFAIPEVESVDEQTSKIKKNKPEENKKPNVFNFEIPLNKQRRFRPRLNRRKSKLSGTKLNLDKLSKTEND